MQLGKIVGTVVSSQKDEKLKGLRFLVVKYVDSKINLTESMVVAIDSVGAGIDELVLVASGSSARLTDVTKDKPVDTVIIAIVDEVDIDGKKIYTK